MSGDVTGIAHVKVPVTDLNRSVSWYRELLGLEPGLEFVEDGVLRGVALVDWSTGMRIALRDRTVCVGRPDLRGFDVFALRVPTAEALERIIERCDRLGLEYERQDRGPFGAALDVPDPDGTVVRFVYDRDEATAFVGLEFDHTGVRTYETPRLE
jgi:catechol 2,3-dioxygenase-like lactoylglutathione lyase family enzyme